MAESALPVMGSHCSGSLFEPCSLGDAVGRQIVFRRMSRNTMAETDLEMRRIGKYINRAGRERRETPSDADCNDVSGDVRPVARDDAKDGVRFDTQPIRGPSVSNPEHPPGR